jgi:SAM-dependent methyltransferase
MDLGCGTGILLPHVINGGGNYVGVDMSDNMMDELKGHYSDLMDGERIKLILGDIREIKLPDQVDVAVGLGFIEYFDKPDLIVQKIRSSLADNGELILSFPNFGSLDYFSLRLFSPFRWLVRTVLGKKTIQPPRTLWNVVNAKELFEKNGFKDIQIVNYNTNIVAYPFTRIMPRFTNSLGKILENSFLNNFSWFATSFIVVGKKK